jgi:hypothetical protein
MIKIGLQRDIYKLQNLPPEVVSTVSKVTSTLEEYYGTDRNIDKDMGGYLLILENEKDFQQLNNELCIDVKNDAIPEFVDLITCSNGFIYTHCLILCNNDFGISLIIPFEITPANLKEYLSI